MATLRRTLRAHWLWIAVNLAALIPLAWLIWDAATGGLSVNPIDDITDRTGSAAIVLLLLSLAVTPVHVVSGYNPILKVRKSLGLYAFLYATLHLLTFVGLDYGFRADLIFADTLLDKRYILVGLGAFLVLVPLAITSTRGWMRRLGRNWKRLHRLAYAAGIFAVLHFVWLAKAGRTEPLFYAAALSLLLLARVPPVRRRLAGLRRRPSARRKTDVPSTPAEV